MIRIHVLALSAGCALLGACAALPMPESLDEARVRLDGLVHTDLETTHPRRVEAAKHEVVLADRAYRTGDIELADLHARIANQNLDIASNLDAIEVLTGFADVADGVKVAAPEGPLKTPPGGGTDDAGDRPPESDPGKGPTDGLKGTRAVTAALALDAIHAAEDAYLLVMTLGRTSDPRATRADAELGLARRALEDGSYGRALTKAQDARSLYYIIAFDDPVGPNPKTPRREAP